MEGVTERHFLRQMKESSGQWVSIAKSYRDEMKLKCRPSAKSQWSSSSILLLRKIIVIWPKVYIFILFHLSMFQQCSPAGHMMLSSVQPFQFCLFHVLPGFSFYITHIKYVYKSDKLYTYINYREYFYCKIMLEMQTENLFISCQLCH